MEPKLDGWKVDKGDESGNVIEMNEEGQGKEIVTVNDLEKINVTEKEIEAEEAGDTVQYDADEESDENPICKSFKSKCAIRAESTPRKRSEHAIRGGVISRKRIRSA